MSNPLFSFTFSGGSSFYFEDLTSVSKTNRVLTITFPNKNILRFQDNITQPTFPNDPQLTGFLGQNSSEILSTFVEWGGDSSLTVNTEELRKDLQYYPEFFKTSGGSNAEFGYEFFPSGVYVVTYSYDSDGSYSETQLIYMDQAANICLKEKIEWLFRNDLEQNKSEREFNLVKDQIMQLIMMMHVSKFDYDSGNYEEANLKLISCDNICSTGSLGYIYDSTRP